MPQKNYDETGGFSMVRIVLSDALPLECFHPDFSAQFCEKLRQEADKHPPNLQ